MSKLEPRIEAVRKQFDLAADDFWQIKQNGQWVCKHAALEVVATKANIEWLPPQIIEANAPGLVTSMVVTGKMGERIEWATGETNPTNYSVKGKQPAYPWAMSEKRAKDRVVLKLVGIHGLVYSEDEADDFKLPEARTTDQRSESGRREIANQNKPEDKDKSYWDARFAMRDALVLKDVQGLFAKAWKATSDEKLRADLQTEYEAKKADLSGYTPPDFDNLPMQAAE